MRRLVYLEDNHGWTRPTYYAFETDCWLPIWKLEELSYLPREAGKMKTSFTMFKSILEAAGYTLNLVSHNSSHAESLGFDEGYEEVKGATGRY